MYISSLTVTGELDLHYNFTCRNVLLGSNKTGKSTFIKLLLYSFGVKIADFIPEISTHGSCEAVGIIIKTKLGHTYQVTRKLPDSSFVTVIPADSEGHLLPEDVTIYDLAEYSDFLLDEELYSKETITYATNKTASLRYYFLLRAAIVDQTTPHSRVLANLSGEQNDYMSNQVLINVAIIEQLLNRNTSEIQRLRLELREKEKERNRINEKIVFVKETLSKQYELHKDYPKQLEKVKTEIEKTRQHINNISAEQYKAIVQYEHAADKELAERISSLRGTVQQLNTKIAQKELQIRDTIALRDKLSEQLTIVRNRLTANKIIQSVPVNLCPICFSKIDIDTLCPHCKEVSREVNIENMASYKRMIEESIQEADAVIEQNQVSNKKLKEELTLAKRKLDKAEVSYLEKLKDVRTPLENIINALKEQLKRYTTQEFVLCQIRDNLIERNNMEIRRNSLNGEIAELRSDIEALDKKTNIEKRVTDIWEKLYRTICDDIFGNEVNAALSDETYMPVLNDIPIQRISSESEKLVAQLSYILSLFELTDSVNQGEMNPLGIALFDSPKDKDLDSDKYQRFLQRLSNAKTGQFFLTGSLKDSDLYYSVFSEPDVFDTLDDASRLLGKRRKTNNDQPEEADGEDD